MRGLYLRFAVILTVSIVAVVVVATFVTITLLNGQPGGRQLVPMAWYISVTAKLPHVLPVADNDPLGFTSRESSQPPEGVLREDQTVALRNALESTGVVGDVSVYEDSATGTLTAAVRLGEAKWMLFDFPKTLVPMEFLLVLGSWLGAIIVGVAIIALGVARRTTRPFALLERVVASVGPDGVLPHTPEVGSGEVRHTAAALNALADRIKSTLDSRMRLVAAAGHDFRTPMTRMRLRAEFLSDEERDDWLGDLDELDAIADSAIRLVREEGAGEDRAEIELDALLRETVDELRGQSLGVTMVSSQSAVVRAGPLALRRALRNVLTNAATHGGGARVSLTVAGDYAHVLVDDDGPGIDASLIGHVFEPFFRADPARGQRHVKGAGLGLAIAKEIIERFGGSISLMNRDEGGLRQKLVLRLARS